MTRPYPDSPYQDEIRAILNEAREALLSQIDKATIPGRGFLRCEVGIPAVSLPDWLAAQHHVSRYYWCDRQQGMEMAGIGDALVIAPTGNSCISDAFSRIREYLAEYGGDVRFYGGFRFHFNNNDDPAWHNFKLCRFVAPLLEIYREKDSYRLACTLKEESSRQAVRNLLREASFSSSGKQASLPRFYDRYDSPDYTAWCTMVRAALSDFDRTDLEKVVLARQTCFQASETINPMALIQRLAQKTTGVYLFCFQPGPERAFIGASPECLYQRHNGRIYSEALAGTCPRGNTPSEDLVFVSALRRNEKDNREHSIVVDAIKETLGVFCTDLHAAVAPGIITLAHCQHLHTPIEGALKPGVTDEMLLQALHPTPAVGGKPSRDAMCWILEKEPFERGIYASPVGWVGKDEAEFCVGIRSGLILGKTLTLYAGAGIVPGSDPQEEWRELNTKLAQFLDILSENGAYDRT